MVNVWQCGTEYVVGISHGENLIGIWAYMNRYVGWTSLVVLSNVKEKEYGDRRVKVKNAHMAVRT